MNDNKEIRDEELESLSGGVEIPRPICPISCGTLDREPHPYYPLGRPGSF